MISYNIVLFHFTYFLNIYMYDKIYYNISYYISLHKIVFKILNCFHSIQFDKDYESFLFYFFFCQGDWSKNKNFSATKRYIVILTHLNLIIFLYLCVVLFWRHFCLFSNIIKMFPFIFLFPGLKYRIACSTTIKKPFSKLWMLHLF